MLYIYTPFIYTRVVVYPPPYRSKSTISMPYKVTPTIDRHYDLEVGGYPPGHSMVHSFFNHIKQTFMNIVLKGREVYGQLQVLPEKLMDKNNNPYYRATYGGKAFIVRPDFKTAWDNASLAEVTITETERTVVDAEGVEHEGVKGFTITGSLTYTQAKGITKNEAELTAITKQVESSFKLDAEEVA